MNTETIKDCLGEGWVENPQPDDKNCLTKSLPNHYHLSVSFDMQNDNPSYWVCLFDGGLEHSESECSDIKQVKAFVERLENSLQVN